MNKILKVLPIVNKAGGLIIGSTNVLSELNKSNHQLGVILISSKTGINTQKKIQTQKKQVEVIIFDDLDVSSLDQITSKKKVMVVGIKIKFKNLVINQLKEKDGKNKNI